MRLLLEMRPALEGHAGIPQENRLLFRALCGLGEHEVFGLLQSGGRVLAEGLPMAGGEVRHRLKPDETVNRMSRVVVSLQPPPAGRRMAWRWRTVQSLLSPIVVGVQALLGRRLSLSGFDPEHFRDFVWRSLFAKTLPASDLPIVMCSAFRVLRLPYGAMHAWGLFTRRAGKALFPTLDTESIDVMIAQTPYPGRMRSPTRLIVRYMDAVPMLLPHTIVKRAFHQASHYEALRRNVLDGAYFACASDASRHDLVTMFPEAAARAVTIHCMLSHHYHLDESARERVPEVLSKRRQSVPEVTQSPASAFDRMPPYVLMVSTLEPRKNHATLITAWEHLRAGSSPGLRLVLVGSLGWDHEPIVAALAPWLERGEAFLLGNVPADELRVLYRHAAVTVCPSVAEGFDYSGVEAMRCGGVVVASDIPVHREVFDEAAEYFDPYAVDTLVRAVEALLGEAHEERRIALRRAGENVSMRYLPERLLPHWSQLLERVRSNS